MSSVKNGDIKTFLAGNAKLMEDGVAQKFIEKFDKAQANELSSGIMRNRLICQENPSKGKCV